MPILDNPRHERFAQGLAAGKTADEAYAHAGYAPSRPHASRLATNGNVKARLAELQERGAKRTEITIAALTDMLLEDRRGARAEKQFSAAISAVEKLAKLHGFGLERKPGDSPDNPVHTRAAPDPASVEDIVNRYAARPKLNGATTH